MKKILILGAGRGQTGLIRAAKEMGYHTIVASIEGDYPGFAMADEVCYTDIRDAEGVAALAAEKGVDAVVSAGTDIALPAVGHACDVNGLPGPSLEAARTASNKFLMKEAFVRGGVNTARHILARSADEADRAKRDLRWPVIVKAVDLEGSRGINIVFDHDDLRQAFARTMEATHQDYCIVEEYLDGYEISATALVAGGEVVFVLPTGDVRYGENEEMPVGHYVPLDCGEEIDRRTREQVVRAIAAIGLDNCAVNSDLMVVDGEVYVLEMTGRLGGNAIPEITSEYLGTDIYRLIVAASMGDTDYISSQDFDVKPDKVCYAQMMISDHDGVLEKASVDDALCDARFFLKAGDEVSHYRNPNDCIGQVAVTGSSKEECAAHVAEILGSLEIRPRHQ